MGDNGAGARPPTLLKQGVNEDWRPIQSAEVRPKTEDNCQVESTDVIFYQPRWMQFSQPYLMMTGQEPANCYWRTPGWRQASSLRPGCTNRKSFTGFTPETLPLHLAAAGYRVD